jgi:hypothetical protein
MTQKRPKPQTITIRGEQYEIAYPSDFRIKQIGEFVDSGISNRSREAELASCVSSMIPDLPEELASCTETTQDDGTSLLSHKFGLLSHELMDVVKAATVGYVEILLHDLRLEPPSADVSNLIAQFERELSEAKAALSKSSLMELSRAAGLALTQKQGKTPRTGAATQARAKNKKGFAVTAKPVAAPAPEIEPEIELAEPFETPEEELARLRRIVSNQTV